MAKQFSAYAAGRKVYGGGRDAPNLGAVNKMGYRERSANLKAKGRRAAIANRLKKLRSS